MKVSLAAAVLGALLFAGTLCAGAVGAAGNISFSAPTNYAVSGGAYPTVVDLDSDGFLDIVQGGGDPNNGESLISVLYGNGDGTFDPLVTYPVRWGSLVEVIGADVNDDGRLDLIAANDPGNAVSVLLSTGARTFGSATHHLIGGTRAFGVVARDFDGDRDLDLAVSAHGSDSLAILRNNGTGAFGPASTIPSGHLPSRVVSADFDEDGIADLAVAHYTPSNVAVFRGNGDGTFTGIGGYGVGSVHPNSLTAHLVTEDFNRDGHADLATSNYGDNSVSILYGNGDGTFQPQVLLSTPFQPHVMGAGDLDGDGDPDLAVPHAGGNIFSTYENVGPSFETGPVVTSGGEDVASLAVGDFNRDGRDDVVTANNSNSTVSVLLSTARGQVAPPTVTSLTPAAGRQRDTVDIIITGAAFRPGATVSFGNGITVTNTRLDSSTRLTARLSIAAGAAPGARDVRVSNPDGQSATLTGGFTVRPRLPAPTLVAVAPPAGRQGQAVNVAITGTGFETGATLAFGPGITVTGTRFISSTRIEADLTIAPNAALGTRDVRVTNPDGQVAALTGGFTVQPPIPAPTLASLTPAAGRQGQTLDVAITGAAFLNGATANFGPGITVASTRFDSSTSLTARLTVEAGATVGPRDVQVTNPDGQVATLAGAFTVQSPVPTVNGVSPFFGVRGRTHSVTITGASFRPGATVSFGAGTQVTGVAVTPTQLTATLVIDAGATPGLRDVTVTNPGGSSATRAQAFAVTAAPATGRISVMPPRFAGARTGQPTRGSLRVRNRGRGPLTFGVGSVTGPFTITGNPGPYVLPPRGSVSIEITFTPPAAGRHSGSVTVFSDDPRKPTLRMRLRGRAR